MNNRNPYVFETSLTFQEAVIKLQARVNTLPPVPLFSKRQVKFPEVAVRVAPDGRFKLAQRKTYFNPWEPTFEGAVQETNTGGTSVQGQFSYYRGLRTWVTLYRAALAGGVVASAVSAYTMLHFIFPTGWMTSQFVSIAWLAGLMIYLVAMKGRCERHYKRLAEGEEAFILSFLQTTLRTRRLSTPLESGTLAEELIAA